MKKYIKYLTVGLVFIAQNIFAQSTAESQTMDMGTYAEWMGSGFLVFLFVMFGFFLFKANKQTESSRANTLQSSAVLIKQKINAAIIKPLSLLPVINLDIRRVRFALTSVLIMFTTILFLLIIQK